MKSCWTKFRSMEIKPATLESLQYPLKASSKVISAAIPPMLQAR